MFKAYDSYTHEETQFENEKNLIEYAKVYANRMNDENCDENNLVTVESVEEAITVLESAMIWVTKKQLINIKFSSNKLKCCEEIKVDGKRFISDYRVKNGVIPFAKGKLGDLEQWYYKSQGLGDLIGSVIIDMKESDYKIIEYKGVNGRMFAVGI